MAYKCPDCGTTAVRGAYRGARERFEAKAREARKQQVSP